MILALVLLAQFMVVLDATIVAVALPSIQSSLDFGSQTSLQWVINAYILPFGGFLLLGGRAGDLYGRRTLFVLGLTLFSAASLLNGLSQSSGTLIAGRAVQGFGAALVVPAVLSIIVATFTDTAKRTRALGVFASVTAGGGAVGLLLGGILTEALSWRWIFLVNVPVGAVAVLLALRRVPNSRAEGDRARTIDVPGAITVTGGVGLLVYAVVNAQAWGWGSTRLILTAAVATAFLFAFVAIELRARTPLVRLGIFRSRSLSAANVTMLLFISGQFVTLFFPTLYMQQVLGYSPIKTGLAYLPWPLAMAATSAFAQRLIPRVGARPSLVIGLALGAAGLLTLSRIPDHGSYAADLLAGFLINAAGAGFTFAALFLVATAGVRTEEAGLASGIINTSQQLGAAVGLAALATVAAARTSDLLDASSSPAEQTHALVAGFQRGFVVAGILLIAAATVALLALPRRDVDQTAAAADGAPPAADSPTAPASIVIAFDGSDNARHAIDVAGRELGGGRAAVLHVWRPTTNDAIPSALAEIMGANRETDRALSIAKRGAALARTAGFEAEPYPLRTDGTVGDAIVAYTDQHATRLIVAGTRGLSRPQSPLVGSVTHHLTQHVHVPVFAVPPEGD